MYGPTTARRWAYAESKALDEFLALAYHQERGLDCVIVRLFNTVGPRQSGQYGMVIPRFVAAALAGRPLEIHGDGTQTRCFCHVQDTIRALAGLMDAPRSRARSSTSARRSGSRSTSSRAVLALTGSRRRSCSSRTTRSTGRGSRTCSTASRRSTRSRPRSAGSRREPRRDPRGRRAACALGAGVRRRRGLVLPAQQWEEDDVADRVAPEKTMASRSMPIPMPLFGAIPYDIAST